MSKSINDFGNKIGGAKKDLWKLRGLGISDMEEMTDIEKNKYVNKKNIWIKPDYEQMYRDGMSKEVVYYIKLVRDAIPAGPILPSETDRTTAMINYIDCVSTLRDEAMKLSSLEECKEYYDRAIRPYLIEQNNHRFVTIKEEAKGVIKNKLLRAASPSNVKNISREVKRKQFLYTDKDKLFSKYNVVQYDDSFTITNNADIQMMERKIANRTYFYYTNDESLKLNSLELNSFFICRGNMIIKSNFHSMTDAEEYIINTFSEADEQKKENTTAIYKKKPFRPQQFRNIERNGDDILQGRKISGEDMLESFGFYGGEFGNWMKEEDRQESLNLAYESFCDLSNAMHIEMADISFQGKLSIAFGARGSGLALAHYEPERAVINLTKMKGAGALAHEWGHALDHHVGEMVSSGDLLCRSYQHITNSDVKEAFMDLRNAMRYKNGDYEQGYTDFYKDSGEFDRIFSKPDKGYYQSETEMFARSFACYIKDQLGFRNDYLCGYANADVAETINEEGEIVKYYAYPRGSERDYINTCMSEYIDCLKRHGILREKPMALIQEASDIENHHTQVKEVMMDHVEYTINSISDYENVKKDIINRFDDASKVREGFLVSVSLGEVEAIDRCFINEDIVENMKMAALWNGKTMFQEFIEWKDTKQILCQFDDNMGQDTLDVDVPVSI